ncbi:MAG: DUF2828 family protein, partial [Clostridia bacterium]|nr:DUF2828 family protein [Clostridia bacterium]
MLNAFKEESNLTTTENGAVAYRSTHSSCLDLFATCGALRGEEPSEICHKFLRAYVEDPDAAIKILFYARDVRGGLGERRFFRIVLRYLANQKTQSVLKNLRNVPEYGRFDDLLELLGTPCEAALGEYLKEQLRSDLRNLQAGKPVSLLAKWLPSVNASGSKAQAKQICKLLHMTEKEYRQTLSRLRAEIDVPETHLCRGDYSFDYEKIPSKALFQYRKAFSVHDTKNYETYIRDVSENRKKMNTSTLYPYELIRAVDQDEGEALNDSLDAAWNALPDYTDGRNAIAVVDGSGSMYGSYNENSPRPIDVALSLGLYFAERNKGKFANHFITFSSTPRLIEIKGNTLRDKVQYCRSYNEVANTNLCAVYALILRTAVKYKLPQSELPEMIYILSDMQFDMGVEPSARPIETARKYYEKYGYRLPQIVYWNLCARRDAFPVDMNEKGVALFSGASPSL